MSTPVGSQTVQEILGIGLVLGEHEARQCWFDLLDAHARAPVSMLGHWIVDEIDQPPKFREWMLQWIARTPTAFIREGIHCFDVVVNDRKILIISSVAP